MMKIVCRQAHIWVSRVKQPKRCPTCSSEYLWQVNTRPHMQGDNMFALQVKDKNNRSVMHAFVHGWELQRQVEKFQNQVTGATFSVEKPQVSDQPQGPGGQIGFSSAYMPDGPLPIAIAVASRNATSLHQIQGSLHLDPQELGSVFGITTKINVIFQCKHLANNTFTSLQSVTSDQQPMTRTSTWLFEYIVHLTPELVSFTAGMTPLIGEYMQSWLETNLSKVEIIFHNKDEDYILSK